MQRYPKASEFEPSAKERAAARTSAAAQQQGSAWGTGIGGALGAGLGALGFFGGPGVGAITLPAGAAAGGALGNAVGGWIGGMQADEADEELRAAEMERQRKLAEMQMRQEALAQLKAVR